MGNINEEYLKKFKRCILEYTSIGDDGIEEDDPNAAPAMGADPNAMGGAMPAADPTAIGAAPMDPNAMGGAVPGGDMNGDGMPDDPNAMGGAMPGGDPNAMGADQAAAGAPGFAPQGPDPNAMPADPNAGGQEGEDTINVDDLTDSQEETEKKIDALTSKFDQLMGALNSIDQKISANDEQINMLKGEMEKRNPTSVEKMTLRSQKSDPFTKSPEEYWENDAPENYSPEDDNNGVGQPQYEITKGDIDNFNDWQSISKNILGY